MKTQNSQNWSIVIKSIDDKCFVCVLTALLTSCFLFVSLSSGLPISWDTALLKLGQLVSIQWPLSVQVNGRVACLSLEQPQQKPNIHSGVFSVQIRVLFLLVFEGTKNCFKKKTIHPTPATGPPSYFQTSKPTKMWKNVCTLCNKISIKYISCVCATNYWRDKFNV